MCYWEAPSDNSPSVSSQNQHEISQDVTDSPAPDKEEEDSLHDILNWQCPSCTMKNDHRSAECSMCSTRRPDTFEVLSEDTENELRRLVHEQLANTKERDDEVTVNERTDELQKHLSENCEKNSTAKERQETIGGALLRANEILAKGVGYDEMHSAVSELIDNDIKVYLKTKEFGGFRLVLLECTIQDRSRRSFKFYKTVFSSITIKRLKEMIFLMYAIPPCDQCCIYADAMVNDDDTLEKLSKTSLLCIVRILVDKPLCWPDTKVQNENN